MIDETCTGCALLIRERDALTARLDAMRAAAAANLGRVERERDGHAAAHALDMERLDKIAAYVGATDYIDSIGTIYEAIDAIRRERTQAVEERAQWRAVAVERGVEIDKLRAERDSAQRDAAETFEKWHTKARVYGAIAARYQRALAKIDHPEARAAEAWRHSESCGVPRSALEDVQSLLDAQTALTRTTAAGEKLAAIVREMVTDGNHWADCDCTDCQALSAWDRRDGEVG